MSAHLGVVVLLVGVAGSSAYAVAGEGTVLPGSDRTVAGVPVSVTGVSRERSGGDVVTRAALVLDEDGRTVRLDPGLRYSPTHDMTVAVPAVLRRTGGDLYVTLLSADRDGSVTVRVARNPLVSWIWAGGALMALAGLAGVVLLGRRERAAASRTLRRAVRRPSGPTPVGATPPKTARAEP